MTKSDLEVLVKDLGRNDIHRYSHYKHEQPAADDGPLSYGDLKTLSKRDEVKETDFYMPPLMGGSDYSGTLVQKSNHDLFIEEHGDVDGVFDVFGGHGTFAVAIRLDAITEEMMESFAALENYPLLNEEKHSEMEMESQNEAWENDIKSDFRKGLTKGLGPYVEEILDEHDPDQTLDLDYSELAENTVDAIDDEKLYSIFHDAADRANEYWVNEQGDTSWIDVKKVVDRGIESSDWEDLAAEAVKSVDWPLDEKGFSTGPRYKDPRQQSLPGVSERRKRR